MSKIRVIVNGAKGKMGAETIKAVLKESDLELVAQLDIGDDLSQEIKTHKAQVVVDFTTPDSAMKNIKAILTSGAHGVVGTTGITKNIATALQATPIPRHIFSIITSVFVGVCRRPM